MNKRAEKEKERRRRTAEQHFARRVDATAHRITRIITLKHNHRLAMHERDDLLFQLWRDGATGSHRCDLDELRKALEKVQEEGLVMLSRDRATGQLVLETERPEPEPEIRHERITDLFEQGELLQSRHARLLNAWGYA
jgi:hypothetical protein